ncbi:MAG TPA: hypothetical protein VMU55_09500 [Solirubrobacteraceae bacterium]|nr:hypothetical protein [Solirubrobacteraceae bacterium]
MRRPGVLVALILAVGIGGTVVALESREGNAQFVLQQQSLAPVGPAALQALLLTTRDSRPGYGGPHARALQVRCSSPSHGALGNPWTCVVRYPRPPRVRFRVIVHADRSISGSGQPEGHPLRPPLTVSGCCVETS